MPRSSLWLAANSCYLVKFGYKALIASHPIKAKASPSSSFISPSFWKFLWKLDVALKVKKNYRLVIQKLFLLRGLFGLGSVIPLLFAQCVPWSLNNGMLVGVVSLDMKCVSWLSFNINFYEQSFTRIKFWMDHQLKVLNDKWIGPIKASSLCTFVCWYI